MCANIDKEQTTGCLGKVRYGTSVDTEFMWLLAVPVQPLPPDSDETRNFGTWAGDRIICVGDYGQTMPAGTLTIDETVQMASDPHIRMAEYQEIETGEILTYASHHRKSYPDDCEWILRNLTKKEFVRASAITLDETPGHLHGYPSLGHALMIQICWTDVIEMDTLLKTSPFAGMFRRHDTAASGECAAHRFDVRALREVEEDMEREDWTDVSEVIALRIRRAEDELWGP